MSDPTVGRTVHYGAGTSDIAADGTLITRPSAAIVTGSGTIEDNDVINLFVMTETKSFHVIGVHHSETLQAGHWTWPPRADA